MDSPTKLLCHRGESGEMMSFPYYKRRRMVTSWPISALWVFLSLSLAVLSTFSFLQADWVVKRDLVVTSFYGKSLPDVPQLVRRTELLANGKYVTPQTLDISNAHFSKFLSKYSSIDWENETIFYDTQLHRVLTKVTKVVTTVRFGLIGVCMSPTDEDLKCFLYEHWNQDDHPVSEIWTMLTLVGGSGCVTLCASAVLSLFAVALPSSHMRHQVAKTIGHAQTVAVVLLILSLLGFPLGFTSGFVRHHCGPSASIYSPGDCEIGWAYALVLVSTSLSLYCPVLVKFTAEIRYGGLPKYL